MKKLEHNKVVKTNNPMLVPSIDGRPADIPKGFDWEFIKSIFDLKSFFFPLTGRKIIFFSLYLSIIGALIWIEREFVISKKINKALNKNVLWLTVITYGMEPFMLLLYMTLARYPYFDPKVRTYKNTLSSKKNIKSSSIRDNQDTVLVIPCHNSASSSLEIKNLKKIIHAALVHFLPSHIIVVNNGKEDKPTDNTQEIIHAINSNIICIYRPCDGNKTRAQLNGVEIAITRYGNSIKYVLFIDDDVRIPKHYILERAFFLDKQVRGIIYPILASSYNKKNILITRWQNIEYQLSDLSLSALDAFKGALAPHGACVLLEIKTAQCILRQHTGKFKGEDKEIGAILRNLYDIEGTLRFRVDMTVHFKTIVPCSYFGYGDNLWKQRVRSWSEAPFLYCWSLVLKPLFLDWRAPLKSLPIIKLTQSYYLLSQCSHILRYYIIFLEAKNFKFWLTFMVFSLVQFCIILLFNYQKLPPYLRNDFAATITFPIYKNIDNALSHIAFWRAILFSLPSEPQADTNLSKLESGKIPKLQLNYDNTENESKTSGHRTSDEHENTLSLKQSDSHPRRNKANKSPLQKLSFHSATSAPEADHKQSKHGQKESRPEIVSLDSY